MTPNINLRPWRDEQRKKSRRRFIAAWSITAGISLAIAIIIPISFSGKAQFTNTQISALQSHDAVLAQKINQLENITDQISAKKAAIHTMETLLESRYSAVYLFNALSHSVSQPIQIQALHLKENQLNIQGTTRDNKAINHFISALNQQDFLEHAKLREIINKKDLTHFKIQARINPMKEDADE